MKQNVLDSQWLVEMRKNLSVAPLKAPTDGWERVSLSLQRRKHHHLMFWRSGAVAAVVVLVLISSVFFDRQAEEIENTISEEQQIAFFTQESDLEDSSQPTPIIGNTLVSEFSKRPIQDATILPLAEVVTAIKKEDCSVSDIPVEPEVINNSEAITEKTDKENRNIFAVNEFLLPLRQSSTSRRWSFGMHVGNSQVGDTESTYSQVGGAESTYSGTGGDKEWLGSFTPSTLYPSDEIFDVIAKNHRSWSFGLTASKTLTQCLSLESGIVYSLLVSEVTLKNRKQTSSIIGNYVQRLHYLGVPISLSFTFYENSLWQLYVSGGGMLERSIFATLDGESFDFNQWQWSINGSLGGQYNLSKHLGLYIEPSLNYYFDDYSGIHSIRNENSFSFNLRLGLRLTY